MTLFRKTYAHLRSFPRDLWILWSATFLNQLGFIVFPFLLLYLTQHLGFSLAKSSFVYVAFGSTLMISSFIAGNIIDRIGPEKVLLTALAGNSLVMFIFPAIHHYGYILIMSMIWGVTFGIYRPASQTLTSFLSPPGEQKITFSVMRLSTNLGMSMGPLLGGFLVAKSFSSIFIVNGISNTIAGIIILLGLKSAVKKNMRVSTKLTFIQTAGFLKQDKILRIFLLGLLPVVMVFFQHEASLAVFLTQNLRFSYHFYGFLFTINTLMIVFFEILLNVATREWDSRTSFIIGSLLITIGFMGFAWVTQVWQIIALTVIWTLGEMILFPAASAFVADIAAEKNRGAYMGLFSMNQNAALLLGLWGGSFLMSYFGAHVLWIICGFWGLLSLVFFTRLPLNAKQACL